MAKIPDRSAPGRSAPIPKWVYGRAARWTCGTLLAVVAAVLFFQAWHRAHRPDGYDLTSFLLSARALIEGQDPYQLRTPFPYMYPLFLAFTLVPLLAVPYGVAVIGWFSFNVSALGTTLAALSWRRIRIEELPAPVHSVVATLVVLLLLPAVQNDLLNGQVNFIVLAACVLSLNCMLAGRRWSAAGLWAVAVAIKLVPLILIPFWIVRREWRLLAAGLAFSALLCLLPGLVSGPAVLSWYLGYAKSFLMPGVLGNYSPVVLHLHYSLAGIIRAHLPSVGGSAIVRLIVPLLTVLLVAAVDLRSRNGVRSTRWAFALYLLTILLVSPESEAHHLTFAIPAAYLSLAGLFEWGIRLEPRQIALVGAGSAFWLGDIVSRFRSELWFAAIVLLGAVAVLGMLTADEKQLAERQSSNRRITVLLG